MALKSFVVAQIAQIVGADAAGPDRAVGVNLGAGPAGIAVDDLILLLQDSLDSLSYSTRKASVMRATPLYRLLST